MSRNLSQGIVQIFSMDLSSINLALLDLQNRMDEAKGLRGRAMVHDRLRLDDPTAADDGVSLGILQAGTAFASFPFHADASSPLVALAPGTTYVELSSLLRQQVNFASAQDLEARVLVEGWGTESGSNKGVAITNSAGTVIAEVLWNGATSGLKIGTFTTVTLDTDQVVHLRVKGASATEALILSSVFFDLRYSIDFVNTP
jgi:hypothetical protein